MASWLRPARLQTPQQQLGLGVLLSAAAHALGLVALGVFVTRSYPKDFGSDARPVEIVAISTISEEPKGPLGWSTERGEPGEAPALRTSSEPVRSTPPAPSRPEEEAIPVRRRPRHREPTEPATAPSLARAERPSPSGKPPAVPPKAAAPPKTSPAKLAAARPIATERAPTAIGVGGAEGPEVAPGGDEEGAAGRTVLAAYRAELKKALRRAWNPQEVYRRVDPHGRLKGSLLLTSLEVRLRADGGIDRAKVGQSSGVFELDEEAEAALRRAKIPPPPAEMLDADGGYDVRCSFYLDVGMFRFAREIHEAVAAEWRPSKAYRVSESRERRTVVRLAINQSGILQTATVVAPSGIDFLDSGALEAVKPGMRLPEPPPAFTNTPGPVVLFLAFSHLHGELYVLRPKERIDEE